MLPFPRPPPKKDLTETPAWLSPHPEPSAGLLESRESGSAHGNGEGLVLQCLRRKTRPRTAFESHGVFLEFVFSFSCAPVMGSVSP